ncbi:phage major capsid protein [Allosphingosinicella deserti]|uniref:Phage major capsid protein n=1 Tax=Allosphingosinicella deserti TaxID=2116704 RepID=A0A2P7QW01_9SPHN|nr:phage major capsid protein [Sphingomonas deserti]PSJ42151.1 phage major capsid protein [Sphingomonas deserti]
MEIKDLLQRHTDAVEVQINALDENVKKALEEAGFVKSVMNELEQKFARIPTDIGQHRDPVTPGQQFIDAAEVKSFLENAGAGRRIGIDVKAITSGTTSGGPLAPAQRDNVVSMPLRPLLIRDLLPVIPVSSGSVEYPRQTTRTNNAATVAEGALKPESNYAFDLVPVPIRTVAHWTLASRQILDDAPQLRATIDNELLFGLGIVEDNQLLNGAGTGTDLSGIYTNATGFAAGSLVVAAPTKLDVIAAAILQNALANIPATGIVMHPSDWVGMQMIKDAAGGYIIGNPQETLQPRLWGLPVVASQAMAPGTFLVGDFRGSATLYDRMAARVEISTEDSDNFRRNMVTLLAEERVGLAVKQPTGFTKGTFAAAITDLSS